MTLEHPLVDALYFVLTDYSPYVSYHSTEILSHEKTVIF